MTSKWDKLAGFEVAEVRLRVDVELLEATIALLSAEEDKFEFTVVADGADCSTVTLIGYYRRLVQ